MNENSTYQQLRSHLAYLKLGAAAEALAVELDGAIKNKTTHTAFLERLLAIEVRDSKARRHAGMLRFANFPAPWRIEDFDFDAQPKLDRAHINELMTMRFIEDAANVLFIGPPGVGKTMLSICLGHASVDAGYRTYYTTAAELVAKCHKAALEGRWAATMRFYVGARLLIIDELGYLPLQVEGAAALFEVISRRSNKGSIVLTTNRSISTWGQIFDDPMIAAAILDRLLDRSSVVQISGDSYRMRAHQARAENLRKGVDHHE